MSARRIDTHHHFVPPFYRAWLAEKDVDAGGLPVPDWSAASSLELMEAHGIETAMLSISTPGVEPGDQREARAMARRVNEDGAETVRAHPGRFGLFATLPLPDVQSALTELGYALDELDADGVVLHANARGTYLGDPLFDELFDELQHRRATVFIHPSALPGPGVPGIPAFAADFLLDSVRAALNLARTGTLDRCPDVNLILSHGGGFLPFAGARLSGLADGGGSIEHGYAMLQRFHLDSALASSPFALPSTLAWARSDHLTYGSDHPYARPEHIGAFTAALDGFAGLDHEALNRTNAEALFPRLAHQEIRS